MYLHGGDRLCGLKLKVKLLQTPGQRWAVPVAHFVRQGCTCTALQSQGTVVFFFVNRSSSLPKDPFDAQLKAIPLGNRHQAAPRANQGYQPLGRDGQRYAFHYPLGLDVR